MARFHFDNNASGALAAGLRGRGHIVVTAAQLGLVEASDPLHLLRAAESGAILLTLDSRFRPLHEAWMVWTAAWGRSAHTGIIWLDHYDRDAAVVQQIHSALEAGWGPGGNLWRYSERHGWKRFIAKRDWRGWAASPLELI